MMMCTATESSSKESLANPNSKQQMTCIKFENQTNSNHRTQDVDELENPVNGSGTIVSIKKEESGDLQDQEATNHASKSVIEQTGDVEYTFKPYGQDDSCDLNPEFAVICSFIIQFGDKLDLTLNIEQLKSSIEDQSKVDESLIDLHVKLLKKVRRYFVRDLWEKALIRYVSEYSYEDAYEIESLGYQKTRPSIKLQLLRRLMDAQFEHDQKFKPSVNLCEANDLRVLPTGRDIHGNTYWHQTDSEGNLRIFQEQPSDYKSWKTVCSNTTELHNLIERLDKEKEDRVRGDPILEPYDPLPEIFPELFIKEEKEVEEEEETEPKSTKKKTLRGKKARGNRGRGKKSFLPALKETEEEDSNLELKTNDPIDKQQANNNVSIPTQDARQTNSVELSDPTCQITIESQVKSTLENLINKVVSSFEYIIKSSTRISTEQVKEETPPVKAPKKRATKRDKPREEVLPRRTSSRIQQIQQKKQAEQEEDIKKMIEADAKKTDSMNVSLLNDDSRSHSISSRTNRKRSESPEDLKKVKNRKKRNKKGQSWKRGKGKKKLSWDKDDSDLSSTSSVTESNEEEDDLDFEEDTFKIETNDLDDEFACEDEETNIEPVIIKRARTARQNVVQDEQGDLNESTIVEEDKPCRRCDKSNDPEWILLCDMCDDGYHTSCCLPPLMMVPDGDWFCPTCEHKMLLTKLQELYTSINLVIEERERERKKTQRMRQAANAKKEPIKAEPVAENAGAKRQRDFLNELNDPLALQALDDEILQTSDSESSYASYKRKPRNRAKRKGRTSKKPLKKRPVNRAEDEELDFSIDYKKTRKTYSRRNVSDDDEEGSETESFAQSSHYSSEEEEEVTKQKTRRARACVSYRFQEYDELIQSAIQGDVYDENKEEDEEEGGEEDASERESSPDNGTYGRGKDMATIEALAYQQENGMIEQNTAPSTAQNLAPLPTEPAKPERKPRKKKTRRLNDLDAASESGNTTSDESFQASSATEAEDDDDDDMTEADISGESDSSIDELVSCHVKSRSKKKNTKRRRSYDSEESEYQPTRTRRAVSKRVSYKESTEDEDDEILTSVKKTKKKDTLSSDEESQVSWRSDENDDSVVNDDDAGGSTSCDSPENAGLVIHEEVEETQVSVTSSLTRLDIKQTSQITSDKLSSIQPVPAAPYILETLQPPSSIAATTAHVAVAKKAQIENSSHTSPNASVNSNCPTLDDSFDEIATPFYTNLKPPMHLPHPPAQQQSTATATAITGTSFRPDQSGQPKIVGSMEKGRDPIKELIQYCNESANSAAMFDSYNQTLSTQKNHSATSNTSPAHPSFYDEDDLK